MTIAKDQIAALLDEVRNLQEQVEAPSRDEEIQKLREERDTALVARDKAENEREQALKHLADTKAAIEWMMGKILIKDFFRAQGSIDVPACAEGWLPMNYNHQDTERLEWINQHGRVGVGQHNQFVLVLPALAPLEETVPDIYNIRDIIDICRKSIHNPET